MENLTLQVDTVCAPANAAESKTHFSGGITCSPFAGGALFLSPEAIEVEIYAVDGRLTRCLRLQKGQNQVYLHRGVYLWQAGRYRGKMVVR